MLPTVDQCSSVFAKGSSPSLVSLVSVARDDDERGFGQVPENYMACMDIMLRTRKTYFVAYTGGY